MPVTRDLTWLTDTPWLFRQGDGAPVVGQAIARAAGKILAASIDHDFLNDRRKGPLGRYFEALIANLLTGDPSVSDFTANILVRDAGRTLGELDFLFRLAGEWQHVEIAVKYYLFVGQAVDSARANQWMGPGLRDNLGRKLDVMDRQLSVVPAEAKRLGMLSKAGCSVLPQSTGLVYGSLFLPFEMLPQASLLTGRLPGLNPQADIGWWMTETGFSRFAPDGYSVLDKPDWLSGVVGHDLRHGALAVHQRPLMVVMQPGGTVTGRGFVVPDDWPRRASQAVQDNLTDS